ncbi:hypothetical protein C2E21_7914 [Chlorella sorokiniana]|uniref:Uncharacterized protein n=1 Tax=Chlorella sorokiniana TaxID=3076 RepID=A0A2P6TGP4_CHLSO|nr:hypothetical protein C2E21_7914 [Chlorella sorokiniana]|eukprot:PRW33294.1 hypothetical protein C2E21_7914 [Chlorella sorokiniana]
MEEETDSDEDLDLFPEEAQGDPEFIIENVLALVLIGLGALALGNVLLKLVIVAYSLVSAAVRYTIIGMFLAAMLIGFQPGRWWW